MAEKDVKKNIVVVAEGEDHPALYRKSVELSDLNLFTKKIPKKVWARVRYRQPLFPAVLNPKTYSLVFLRPVKFVASGQSAVFYDKKGAMLGGGIIN